MPFQKHNDPIPAVTPAIDSIQALRDLEKKIQSQAAEINLLRQQLTVGAASATSLGVLGDDSFTDSTPPAPIESQVKPEEKVSEALSSSGRNESELPVEVTSDEAAFDTKVQAPDECAGKDESPNSVPAKEEVPVQQTDITKPPQGCPHPVQGEGNGEGSVIQGAIAEYRQHVSSSNPTEEVSFGDRIATKKRGNSSNSDLEAVCGATPDQGNGPKKPKMNSFKSHDEEVGKVPKGTVGIENYGEKDVISGRGGGTNNHPGNMRFRELINCHRRQYLSSKKLDKPAISRSVVNKIRQEGGRFLKYSEKKGLWYEMGDDAAREKTAQALRQRAREMRQILFGGMGQMLQGNIDGSKDPGPVYKYNNTGTRDDIAFMHAIAEARSASGSSMLPNFSQQHHHQQHGAMIVPSSSLDPSRLYPKKDPSYFHKQHLSQADLFAQQQQMQFQQSIARRKLAAQQAASNIAERARVLGRGIPSYDMVSSSAYPKRVSLDADGFYLTMAEGQSALMGNARMAPQGMYPRHHFD